jgi:PAS domain S-box-containing protein
MLTGLLLLEGLSIGLFALFLVHLQAREISFRAHTRLEYEAESLALLASDAFAQQRSDGVGLSVKMMGDAPTVALAKVTDQAGKVLSVSKGRAEESRLDPEEAALIPLLRRGAVSCFTFSGDRWECAHAIVVAHATRGFAWVEFDKRWMHAQYVSTLSSSAIFGTIWLLASAILVLLMGRTITQPLAILHEGATSLMSADGGRGRFPLQIAVHNEIGDLIETFNRMVASLAEQRAGLNDTLSLLDSMLANAPIGLAFVDRNHRFVRVNQIFADLTGVAISSHLGRALPELLPSSIAGEVQAAVKRVFSSEEPVRNLEIGIEKGKPRQKQTWLISAYPVRTSLNQMRWVGIIALDSSDRKRSEEALRRSEKLAVTGRLAAAIAHEINNPLEAITNLLFLLNNCCELPESARQYVTTAENEVRRIAEITQQTLRFYRQPSQPARVTLAELLDFVLKLFQSRIRALDLRVERDYDASQSLFCVAGELRQVFANLVGNAIDASSAGGRLVVRVRRSRDWKQPERAGIRFAIADTGMGMEPEVREHLYEAFFTTKEAKGTGLGLWVSHEIVAKHGGLIHIRSRAASTGRKDSGTVFELFIPDGPCQTQEADRMANTHSSAGA